MKKISVIVCLFFAFNATAQIKKGSWMLGGTAGGGMMRLGGNADDVIDFKGHFFSFSPEIGYFLTPKLAVGARLKVNLSDFSYARNTTNFGVSYLTWKDRSYEFAPFMRYYFYTKRAFNFYYQFNASGTFSHSLVSVSGSPGELFGEWNKYPVFYLSNSLGLDYFLTKKYCIRS